MRLDIEFNTSQAKQTANEYHVYLPVIFFSRAQKSNNICIYLAFFLYFGATPSDRGCEGNKNGVCLQRDLFSNLNETKKLFARTNTHDFQFQYGYEIESLYHMKHFKWKIRIKKIQHHAYWKIHNFFGCLFIILVTCDRDFFFPIFNISKYFLNHYWCWTNRWVPICQ